MATNLLARRRYDYSIVAFSALAAIIFLVFQLTIIFTVVTFRGSCMYTMWLPDGLGLLSPYWITVGCVLSLIAIAFLGLVHNVLIDEKDPVSDIIVYSVGIIALLFWLYALRWLWLLMGYERGYMSLEELQQSVRISEHLFDSLTFSDREPHVCRAAT